MGWKSSSIRGLASFKRICLSRWGLWWLKEVMSNSSRSGCKSQLSRGYRTKSTQTRGWGTTGKQYLTSSCKLSSTKLSQFHKFAGSWWINGSPKCPRSSISRQTAPPLSPPKSSTPASLASSGTPPRLLSTCWDGSEPTLDRWIKFPFHPFTKMRGSKLSCKRTSCSLSSLLSTILIMSSWKRPEWSRFL